MSHQTDPKRPIEPKVTTIQVTVEEVNRVLEVGRLLFSVLTEEEIAELQRILNGQSEKDKLGNTGVT